MKKITYAIVVDLIQSLGGLKSLPMRFPVEERW